MQEKITIINVKNLKIKVKKKRDRIKEKQRTPQNHNRPNVEAGVYKRNRKCD